MRQHWCVSYGFVNWKCTVFQTYPAVLTVLISVLANAYDLIAWTSVGGGGVRSSSEFDVMFIAQRLYLLVVVTFVKRKWKSNLHKIWGSFKRRTFCVGDVTVNVEQYVKPLWLTFGLMKHPSQRPHAQYQTCQPQHVEMSGISEKSLTTKSMNKRFSCWVDNSSVTLGVPLKLNFQAI